MALLYPDISRYQAGLSLTGAPVVFAKATQGVNYTDPTYAGFRAQAHARGALFVGYHWLDTTPPAAQAAHCFSVVGPDVPLMIDDEQQRVVVGHTLEFVAAYRRLGGNVRFEYVPPWLWASSGRPDLVPFKSAGLHIISSRYVAAYSDTGPGWASYGGITPTVWQWTDRHLFNGKFVDFNAFRGDRTQFAALMGATPTTGGADVELTDIVHLNTKGDVHYNSPTITVEQALSSTNYYAVLTRNLVIALQAAVAGDATRDAGMLAAIKALAAGGGVDAAPILAAIHAEADQTRQLVTALQGQVAALQTENADLRARLAAGAKAESDALNLTG